MPEKLQKDAEMYAGCVSGAIEIDEYLGIIENQGFRNTEVHKLKEFEIPTEILSNYLNAEEMLQFRNKEIGIFSITVSATK